MKILSILILTLALGKGCNSDQQQDAESAVIVYTANTRGFYQKITIQNLMLLVSHDRNGNDNPKPQKISDSDKKELAAAFQEIDLEDLPNLKAPTEKRLYDGAAIGNLKITYKGKDYETTGFDHGYPPVEIERLVNKLNAMVKQQE